MSCNTGFDGKAYYNTGTDSLPTWVEITMVRDVSTTSSVDKADVSDRRSKFKQSCPSMIDLETTMTLTYENGDSVIAALRTHHLDRTPVQIAIMDGDIAVSGTEGFKYYSHVFSQDFSQPLSDGSTIDLTFAPAISPASDADVFPSWYIVA